MRSPVGQVGNWLSKFKTLILSISQTCLWPDFHHAVKLGSEARS